MSEYRMIHSFAKEVKRKNSGNQSQADVYSVTKHDGFVRSLDYFKRQVFSRDLSTYKVVKKGEFAYSTIHLEEGALGLLEDMEALISPMYTVFQVDESIDEIYLSHVLISSELINKYGLISQGSVNRRKSLPFSSFAELEVFTPPLPEQKKIAEILSGIDQLIITLEQNINAKLELFSDLLQDHFSSVTKNDNFTLGDILAKPIQYGANASAIKLTPGSPRYIRITDINEDGTLCDEGAVGISLNSEEYADYYLNNGDLLLARSGNTIGKSYLHINSRNDLIFAGYLLRISINAAIYKPDYLFLFTQSEIYKRWVSESSRTGAQPNINAKEYASMLIPSISVCQQEEFIDAAMSIRNCSALAKGKIKKLKILKQAIAADLLSGRKRVSV
ncbi:MAG: restriction endonuclease subunit S [Cyanobacteria bacterium MAG CAR1_bin_15]|nr:restriction endonuclease subunit S [Cyanobacteria bacterium MAG CAR1_bin_15]